MARNVAEHLVDVMVRAGVRTVYGMVVETIRANVRNISQAL